MLIQFGHNDMKSKAPDALDQYKNALVRWVQGIKRKGATPVLITSVNRHSFKDGQVTNSLNEYPQIVRDVAGDTQEDVALIDLHAMSKTLYEALGPQESIRLFEHNGDDLSKFDPTHHSPYGAYELAKCVIEGVKENKLELAKFCNNDAEAARVSGDYDRATRRNGQALALLDDLLRPAPSLHSSVRACTTAANSSGKSCPGNASDK